MANKTAKGVFTPKNPLKYIGKSPITFRSSWELTMMMWFDKHPYIIQWASESIEIPYKNPLTNRWTVYIPDFVVVYADGSGSGAQHVEMVEIKPMKECPGYQPKVSSRTGRAGRVSKQAVLAQVINAAKWSAAMAYCQKRGWKWRVVTEESLYNYKS
jgi:hypothetical protein